MIVLVGVAASFGAAFLSHTAKPVSVASKLAQANHPVAVSPQWLPVLLSRHSFDLRIALGRCSHRGHL